MRIIWIIALIVGFTTNDSFGYTTNPDMDYVWARSGLNVRSGPGTDFDIIDKLVFGDSVMVISETDISYNVNGISEVDERQHYYSRSVKNGPFILYGKWVEVYTPSGKFGFVINQYLIKIKPNTVNPETPFIEVSRDTTDLYDGIEIFETNIAIEFNDGITGHIYGNKACYGEGYELIGFTIQEVFVMVMNGNFENLIVTKNWPQKLILSDGWYYELYFEMKDGKISYSYIGCC